MLDDQQSIFLMPLMLFDDQHYQYCFSLVTLASVYSSRALVTGGGGGGGVTFWGTFSQGNFLLAKKKYVIN